MDIQKFKSKIRPILGKWWYQKDFKKRTLNQLALILEDEIDKLSKNRSQK